MEVRVLGFGTYDVSRHPRVGILLDGLRNAGDEVHEIDVPVGFSTAQRVDMMHRPIKSYRFVLRLLSCWAQLTWRGRRAARRLDPEIIVVGYLAHFDVVLARLVFPRRRIVLDHLFFAGDTAADRGVDARSVKLRMFGALDRLALRCADVIVVDTAEHAALVPTHRRADTVVVAVGAPTSWFAPVVEPHVHVALRVVFYGLYTPLQGAPTIGAALALLAGRTDIEVTMIGAGQDLAATRKAARPNRAVTWTDWVDPEELLALVAAHDVCLGIFAGTPKALRVVPNKVFQGAAAGCAIVTSDTEPQRRAFGTAATYVPVDDAAALAAALIDLAADRPALLAAREGAYRLAIDSFRPLGVVAPLRTFLARLR